MYNRQAYIKKSKITYRRKWLLMVNWPDCYLPSGCSSRSCLTAHSNGSNSPNRSCKAAESVSHTPQNHISSSSSIPAQAFDSTGRLILHSQTCVQQKRATVGGTDRGLQTNDSWRGSVCCDRSAAVNDRSISWRQIYSGLRTERQTPLTLWIWEGGWAHDMRRPSR